MIYNFSMERDNKAWLEDLKSEGERQNKAITDLHQKLLRILPYALSQYLPRANEHFEAFLEDVAQETLLRVLDHLETFEGRSKFSTWVYTIAVRVGLSELRLRKWKEVSLESLQESDDSAQTSFEKFESSESTPETAVQQAEAFDLVMRIIDEELSPRQRAVMVAVVIDGVPLDVVAERVDSNRNAIYKMMHDARIKIKHRLEREGQPPEEILKIFST
jgi:RNA polymerase sigma-70 factor (ECF subfamily)